ncbi:LysR family transcriptional regulator [Dactylosporangium sp. NPDC048998]|uniref:LysR family transcriptional regulator n=1 Tax=Dactylosporangium sp. NPDC048998 TaxID=3363976 RepID=UPI00371281B4
MDTRRLRLLLELSRRGSMREVAEELHVTTSTVSQQLAVLAKEAGATLIEPDGRRVRLTPAGRRLAEHAVTILAAVEAARLDLDPDAEPSGTLRVAGFATAVRRSLLPLVAELAERHPRVRLLIHEHEPDEAFALLAADEIDLALTYGYNLAPATFDSSVSAVPLWSSSWGLGVPATSALATTSASATSPAAPSSTFPSSTFPEAAFATGLSAAAAVPGSSAAAALLGLSSAATVPGSSGVAVAGHAAPSDGLQESAPSEPAREASTAIFARFRDEDWIVNSRNTADDQAVRTIAGMAGFEPRIAHRADNLNLVQDLIVAGLGVGLLPMEWPTIPGVRILPLTDPPVTMRAYAVTRRGRASWPPLALLLNLLRRPSPAPPPYSGAAMNS